MKNVIRTSWRDAATLILLCKHKPMIPRCQSVNYDILFQTRTSSASFANSVVFPGGVTEPVDAQDEWLKLFRDFGYDQHHFDAFHRPGAPLTPIFRDNPVRRHVALRITAIRETFEELGILICSKAQCKDRTGLSASVISDIDIKHWQNLVSKNPKELLNLCKEYKCYPDIWALHYWSNWLTPPRQPKRFDTIFFVTALDNKPKSEHSSEVVNAQWSSPSDTLKKFHEGKLVLFPPQVYELYRLSSVPDCDQLIQFAAERSSKGNELLYPVVIQATDGELHLLPGDDLYPSDITYDDKVTHRDQTVLKLREGCLTLRRFELQGTDKRYILKNFKPDNHIDMGDRVLSLYA